MRPELLYKPCNRRIPKIRLNFLYAVTWKRLQSWKYVRHIFEKIFKLSFVKFSPMKGIASKKCKCRFSKLSAGVQKRCRKCRFCGLKGTLSCGSNFRRFLRMHWAVVLKMVDIDPQGSIEQSKGSMNGYGVEWGSLNDLRSSKHIFGLCIISSCVSSKKYSNLIWHIFSLY